METTMVSIPQIQNGVMAYLEKEFLPVLSGWKKPVAATAIALYAQAAPQLLDKFFGKKAVSVLGLYKDGMIDLDKIYAAFVENMSGPVSVDIPALGTVQLTRQNVDDLYAAIKGAKS